MTAAVTHARLMTGRHLRALARQPWWIAISLAQPLVYLLLFSAAFRSVADIPGFSDASYIDYFTPGVVVVTALFSGGWAGMGIINDLDRGIVDRFLASPVRPGALVAGVLGHQAVVTVIQSLIVIGLGLAVGASLPGGPAGVLALIACAVLLGTGFAALSVALALLLRREESVVGAVQMLVLPLTFLSTVWMQRSLMPGWIQAVTPYNPLDWAAGAGREAVGGGADPASVLGHLGMLAAFALAWAGGATRPVKGLRREG